MTLRGRALSRLRTGFRGFPIVIQQGTEDSLQLVRKGFDEPIPRWKFFQTDHMMLVALMHSA